MPTVPPALQTRSRLTHDRIFRAGTRLLEAGGAEALTVAAVASEAGVAVGSVYRRFGDKERLLGAILARFLDDFQAEFERRVAETRLPASAPPADVVDAAVTGIAAGFEAHAPLLRVLMLLGTRDQAVREQGARASIAGSAFFRRTLSPAVPHIRRDDADAAIDYAYRFTYSACAHRVIHGEHLESARPSPWGELIAELSTAVRLYLLGTVPPAPAGGVESGP
jgi:AcrR family transcriptional regulator